MAGVTASGAAVPAGAPTAIPIVALDVPDAAAALALVERLGDRCGWYKVGLELFAAEGPSVVHALRARGKAVFVDLKLHDIPNTVRGAARSVARAGASLLTVHASGGAAMIAAAVAGAAAGAADAVAAPGADRAAVPVVPAVPAGCGVLAVTVLTSMDAEALAAASGRPSVTVADEVVRLAQIAAAGGAAGVVCSGHEVRAVRAATGDALGCLVPGLRLAGSASDDQARVMTPGAAAAAGARWLVLGRTVTSAASPAEAMGRVLAEVAGAA